MKKLIISLFMVLLLASCGTKPEPEKTERVPKETPNVASLRVMDLDEYDNFLEEKGSAVVYFGWITRCGDSLNFQENYLEDLLIEHPQLKENMFIVNLDEELPDALVERDKREPLTEKYDVTFSPTLLLVKEGKTVKKVEWTLKESDPDTGISREVLDDFFDASGYLK